MSKRLWVVEAQFMTGTWEICDFGTKMTGYVSTNFYKAHDNKRDQQLFLKGYGSKTWTQKRFRVREYIPKVE